MEIVIDLTALSKISYENPFFVSWFIFGSGGWIVFLIIFLWGGLQFWLKYIREKYQKTWDYVLLAIDIPKEIEQTPKAVEQIFTHLAGSQTTPNFIEKYWQGKVQENFSFEVISIDGYIQFLIRTTSHYRDLIEAAVFAQYPEAEITEVEDYAEKITVRFPSEEYDLWGTEFVLTKLEAYPLKTYPKFEHELTQLLKDPMAAILEILSRARPQEQIWLQLVVTPIKDTWKEKGENLVNKLIGKKSAKGGGLISDLLQEPGKLIEELKNQIAGLFGTVTAPSVIKESLPSLMQFLSPGERGAIEAIQNKISKIGFKTKFRLIYFAPKEIFNKPRGVAAVTGAIYQFNTLDLNGFKPHKKIKTNVKYFLVNKRLATRQNKILKAYQLRSNSRGAGEGFVLNIEELASLWHFPVAEVKAPLVKKIEAKKAEPPVGLPIEESLVYPEEAQKEEPPPQLPLE